MTLRVNALALACLMLPLVAAHASAQLSPEEEAARYPLVDTPTTLWFHLNGFQEFPINTQQPDDRYSTGDSYGLLGTSVRCVDSVTGLGSATALARGEFHTIYGYVSPGYVEYTRDLGGKPIIHQERGISADVQLVGDEVRMRWFVETHALAGNPSVPVNTLPVVVPNVVVKATMRAADAVSVGNEKYDDGALIAQGRAGPFTLAGEATSSMPVDASAQGSVAHHALDGRHVYEFTLAMPLEMDVIPQETGANLRVDVYAQNAACAEPEEGYLMPNLVRLHSSPAFRPRMELVVRNPIMATGLHPMFVAGDLVVHAAANSPWGNYDVDEGSLELSISGPRPPRAVERVSLDTSLVHGHNRHTEDLPAVYVWDQDADPAEDGIYTVTFRVRNDNGTAEAVATTRFQVGDGECRTAEGDPCEGAPLDDGGKDAAAPAAGVLAALLAGGAVALRRRVR